MIDIKGGSKDPRAARLSNFTDRPFVFDGVQCAGVEGILQALKEFHFETQAEICAMSGKLAKKLDRNEILGKKSRCSGGVVLHTHVIHESIKS